MRMLVVILRINQTDRSTYLKKISLRSYILEIEAIEVKCPVGSPGNNGIPSQKAQSMMNS